MSELAIGLTLVSIGTSLPELATSLYAAFQQDSDFIIGNIAGSNVTNISLILGAALICGGAVAFPKSLLKRDIAFMNYVFLLTVLLFAFLRVSVGENGESVPGFGWICGLVLLCHGGIYCRMLFKQQEIPENAGNTENFSEEDNKSGIENVSLLKEFLLLIVGLLMIFAGSKGMVDPVIWTAGELGVSTMVISATIVAFGTSVPELAVSIAGVIKKCKNLVLGNIIGSCIFNILLIFGACALVSPLAIRSGVTGWVNVLMMIPVSLLLTLFMITGKGKLNRICGLVLVLVYLVFLGFNAREAFF